MVLNLAVGGELGINNIDFPIKGPYDKGGDAQSWIVNKFTCWPLPLLGWVLPYGKQ